MADSSIPVTSGSGNNVDTRTNAAGDHRQVVVLGHESATDSVAAVQATDPSSSALGLVVRDPYSTTIVSGLDSVRVRDIVTGTIATVTTVGTVTAVTGITNSIAAHILSTNGTLAISAKDGTFAVSFSPGTPAVLNIGSQANTPFRTNTDGALKIYDIVTGTIATVSAVTAITNALPTGTNDLGNLIRVKNVIDGTLTTITGVDRVRNVIDGTLTTVTGVDRVRNVIDGTIGISRFGANAVVTPNAGIPAINIYSTTSIFTVSGSVSGSYPSGFTLVAPSASYNFKVFAYSLQTTGIVSEQFTFTNGGGSPTEFWRPLVTAANTTSAPVGANLAIQPPGFIFATGTSTTLALKSATGSLVHYSVSYIKESA